VTNNFETYLRCHHRRHRCSLDFLFKFSYRWRRVPLSDCSNFLLVFDFATDISTQLFHKRRLHPTKLKQRLHCFQVTASAVICTQVHAHISTVIISQKLAQRRNAHDHPSQRLARALFYI
jgi:hypothetical protein